MNQDTPLRVGSAKLRKENDELKTKTDLLNQLNLLLMKITENSL